MTHRVDLSSSLHAPQAVAVLRDLIAFSAEITPRYISSMPATEEEFRRRIMRVITYVESYYILVA
ncbi:hypothetical protein EXIGLDRAFT_730101 [Exidia glandulosa HHB12029]|uniref:Uncharacterized protein n=1 Tax=Exidia glandulosa HHB12029 TaxID=1314781 RepID=A0A165LDG8_EXIGL|nr:hypothetical protein EXIGLDRAFT_730101 [Exidia glandulosa HHB12029]